MLGEFPEAPGDLYDDHAHSDDDGNHHQSNVDLLSDRRTAAGPRLRDSSGYKTDADIRNKIQSDTLDIAHYGTNDGKDGGKTSLLAAAEEGNTDVVWSLATCCSNGE